MAVGDSSEVFPMNFPTTKNCRRTDVSDKYVPLALSNRRDPFGLLVVSQTELLSHVWLPIINSRLVDLTHITWTLRAYVCALRGASLPVHPTVSMLLIHILASQGKFNEICRNLQMMFLPDSPSIAGIVIDLADGLEEDWQYWQHRQKSLKDVPNDGLTVKDSEQESPCAVLPPSSLNSFETNLLSSAFNGRQWDALPALHQALVIDKAYLDTISVLRRLGLDMLWRLQELGILVRWMLSHGAVYDAMSVCMSNIQSQPGNTRSNNNGSSSSSSSSGSSISRGGCLSADTIPGIEFFRSAVAVADRRHRAAVEEQIDLSISFAFAADLFSHLYRFLKNWEAKLVARAPGGISPLADLEQFPSHVFEESTALHFRSQLGF